MTELFSGLPLSDLQALNESKSKNVPDSAPASSPIDLNIQCGPILKLFDCNNQGSGKYLGTILLILEDHDELPSVTYEVGDLASKNVVAKGEFKGKKFYSEHNYQFYRYLIELPVADTETVVHYSINGQSTPYWKFYIPSAHQAMNVVSYSCNGFSLACDADQYPSSLWYDVLHKHDQLKYHVMLGGGDQIYCDSIKIFSKAFNNWTKIDNKNAKANSKVDDEFVDDVSSYYLNHYFGWFGKGFWKGKSSKYLDPLFPISMSTIPSVNVFDDHDIIDGFGSYPDETMGSPVFRKLGNLAFKYYMIFQHGQLPDETLVDEFQNSWITGKRPERNFMGVTNRSIYSKLGKGIGLVGLDCRTERSLDKIINHDTYKAIFDRLQTEIKANPDTKHLLVMLGVPILYPRLVWLEKVLTSPLLKPIKKLAELGVINKGLLNEFDGSVEVLDDLNDHWCAKNHKAERNLLVKRLLDFGANNSVRVTILSGDVHLGCIGRLKSRVYHHPTFHPVHKADIQAKNTNTLEHPEYDPRLIFNVTSSAIINAPPPDAMANLLNKRSKIHHFNRDCDEDVVPLFNVEPSGGARANLKFLNKRNWSDLVIAPNSRYSGEKLDGSTQKFPGSVKVEPHHTADKEGKFVKYPLLEDSLVTTLHVEDDPKDFGCSTMGYEVLIPPLVGLYELDDVAIKHVNESE